MYHIETMMCRFSAIYGIKSARRSSRLRVSLPLVCCRLALSRLSRRQGVLAALLDQLLEDREAHL